MEKSQGEALYDYFCDYIRAAVYETIICNADSQQHACCPDWFLAWKTQRLGIGDNNNQLQQPPKTTTTATLDPSIPPESVLRDDPRYGSWDDATGLPRTVRNGDDDGQHVPLTKSATKRLRKLLDAHAKRHAKWKAEKNTSGTTTAQVGSPSAETPPVTSEKMDMVVVDWDALLRDAPVVAGSFGKRQGLELQSDMGPFCHVFRI